MTTEEKKMPKAILEIDLPESCRECMLFTNYRDGWCKAKPELYVTNNHDVASGRHKDCPLTVKA